MVIRILVYRYLNGTYFIIQGVLTSLVSALPCYGGSGIVLINH